MRRNRNVLIAAVVVAGLLLVFLATRSRGNDDGDVKTTASKNCPPVARHDAAATTPNLPVSVDVLANDTDPDGDPLVFQILETTGGTSTVDDGATPTDASDDRVLFTPAVPAPPSAVVEYQAIDPRGALATSTVEVSINELGSLPDDSRSESVTSEEDEATETGSGRCGGESKTTTTTETATTLLEAPSTTALVEGEAVTTETTTRGGRSTNTTTKRTSSKATTTTAKKSTATTEGSTATTQQPPPPPPPPPPSPTTTRPPSTTNAKCGEFPREGTEEEQRAWFVCQQGG